MNSIFPHMLGANNKKRALVIGNDHYRQGKTLRNCAGMARVIHDKLSKIQFQVTLCIDVTFEQFDTILEDFTETINTGDLVFFFFSGYGTYWNDQNYLLTIDDHHINALTMFNNQAIRIDEMMELIKDRNPSSCIYVFDTFRSYALPYVTASNGLNDFGGLGPVEALDGSIIIFPCEPNKILTDSTSNGRLNVFFLHFLENIDKTNVSIIDMLDLISEEVLNETNNDQCPYRSNALQKSVYLNYQIDYGHRHQLSAQVQSIIAAAEPNTTIDLKNEQIIDKDMDNIVQQAIIQKQCRRLWLSNNKLTCVAAEILAPILIGNKHLERLYLFGNRLSDKGIKLLANALGNNNNHTLKILHVQDNSITDAGMEYLADMLRTNMTLMSLWIGKNEISDMGVQIIANALQSNKSKLEHLDLSGNRKITDACVPVIQEMLKYNYFLNELSVYDCSLSRHGKDKLRKTVKTKKNFSLCVNNWNE